jgi:CheY-like chemotaxis protein
VVTASDGSRALEIVSTARPACVLLDVMMPGISGLEVLHRLKVDQATAAIPVILVTAKGEDADAELGHREGAAAYVTKPFKAAQIVDAVRKVLAAPPDPARSP